MRYRLSTLMFLLTIGPPILAGAWLFRDDVIFLITGFVWFMTVTTASQLTALVAALILGGLLGVVMLALGYGHTTSRER